MKSIFSIKNKIFFTYSILVIFVLIATVFMTNQMTRRISIDNATKTSERELALITNNLDSKISHIFDYIISVAVDPQVVATLKKYPAPPHTAAEQYYLRVSLSKVVGSIMGINRNIDMWDLIALNDSFFGVSGYNTSPAAQALGENYFTKVNRTKGTVIQGPYFVNGGFPNSPAVPKFVVSKAIVDLDNMETLGYAAFFVKETSFASIFEENMPANTESKFYILDENNTVLSSSEKVMIGKNFLVGEHLSESDLSRLHQNGTIIAQNGNDGMLYTSTTYQRMNWRVIDAVPLDSLLTGQAAINRFAVLMGVAACAFSLLLSFFLSRTLSKPILILSKAMEQVSHGNLNQSVAIRSNDEIAVLYVGFNNLMEKVNSLLEENYYEQEEKNKYQFQLLQSQIKPHFLYNTLETIKSLVDLGLNHTASEAISAIAFFYRISLNNGSDIISVQKELELSKQYMYIQKLRYHEYFDYRITACDGLENCYIPKLTLQPILENAIYHGIKEKQEKGMIDVHIEAQDHDLIFTVTDNGVGMSENALREIQNSVQAPTDGNSRSFGLGSINRRIQLLYGKHYGITIDSQIHRYTKVTLTIPQKAFMSSSGDEAVLRGKE